MNLDSNTTNKILNLLTESRKIVISTHHNPDGDAIGSSLGLYSLLKKLGHEVSVITPNDYPEFLKWLPNTEIIQIFTNNPLQVIKTIKEAEIIFSLDYNALHRVRDMEKHIKESEAKKILIDHHIQPEKKEFDLIISDVKTTSTAELVYDFINLSGNLHELDKEISECLFVGIMTDTGSFSYACNLKKTYLAVAEMVSKGIDIEYIHSKVYDTFSEDRLRLLGFCLSDRMVVLQEFATAYIFLAKEDLERFNHQPGDTEGIVNFTLSIKGIYFAAFFAERTNKIRISFRSKGNFSVNEFARNHFNGGGHMNAAGGDSFTSIEEAIKKFRSLLPDYKDLLIKND